MRTLVLTMSSLIVFPLFLSNALAIADTPENCASIELPAKRLDCYDSFFRNQRTQQTQAELKTANDSLETKPQGNASAQTEAVARSVTNINDQKTTDMKARMANVRSKNKPDARLVTELEKPLETNKPVQTNNDNSLGNPASNQSPIDLFGAERIAKDDVSIPVDVSFTVSSISENQRKVRTFTFSNDQVWREVSKNRLRVREGDSVTISKGTFTAYYLSKEGVNRKTQVKRIR